MAFSISDFMATPSPPNGSESRPGSLRSTKSFPRHENQGTIAASSRSQRANTLQNGSTPEITVAQHKSPQKQRSRSDAFEATEEDPIEPPRASVDLDDIPIELVSMTDKYVRSKGNLKNVVG